MFSDTEYEQQKIHQQAKVEMWIKAHEDPLYQICQEEQSARRRLLDNPLKLRELQEKMKQDSNKASSRQQIDNSDNDPEANELVKQYLALIEKKNQAKKLNRAQKEKHSNDVSSRASKKMSKEDRDRRLMEMQQSAHERNEHRAKTVSKYQKQVEEEKSDFERQNFHQNSLHHHHHNSANSNPKSLHDALRRNRFRNQKLDRDE